MLTAAIALATATPVPAQEQIIGKNQITLTSDRLTPEALWAMGRIGSMTVSPDNKQIVYTVSYYSVKQNKSHTVIYLMNADGTGNTLLTTTADSESEPSFSIDGKRIFFLSKDKEGKQQIFDMKTDGTDRRQLSHSEKDVEGYAFSPDQKKVILIHQVDDYTAIEKPYDDLPQATGMVIKNYNYRHWDHYVTSIPHLFVGSFDGSVINNETDILKGEPYECPMLPFGGTEQFGWSPDSKKVYMIEVNREQNEARLMRYDALTGELEACLYTERHPKYVEPLHPIQFLPWDGQKFIYQSQRDGYNHLYLFDLSKAGKDGWQHIEGRDGEWQENVKVTQLTSGQWVVRDMAGFDVKNKSVIITANTLSPIQANIFSVKVSNGKRNLIGNDEGVHYVRLSSKGSYLTDTYSSPSVARSINILKASDGRGINLITADDPWKDYDVPEITCGSIKAADGVTDLYYRMVKPVGFDPSKKYPTIVYVYGGPHAHNVEASRNYLSRGWEIYMAQKGYLLFILDNRGSELRGADFENVTFRHLGIEEMKDQMEGVKFLHSLPYVDKDRMGVHGWSFGGFMTINLMLTYPDVFKVGVAGGPVVDWKYYEVMYGERYMDRPQDNPEGYQGSSLLPKVGNLKGKLQIINGYNDPVCVPQHTLSFLRACIDAGKQVDYFTYPGDGHNMFGQDQVHLHERITQYFEDYLK